MRRRKGPSTEPTSESPAAPGAVGAVALLMAQRRLLPAWGGRACPAPRTELCNPQPALGMIPTLALTH